jgi:hypothetical protein
MNEITGAIIVDDASTVTRLLEQNPTLVSRLFRAPKLFQSGIFHWIYVGDTILHLAAAGYRVDIVRLLVNAGADPNAATNRRRSTPLHYAADGFITGPVWSANRQVKTLRTLIEGGANIHAQDMNGATPLHRAVRTRCAEAVRFLLSAGSDPTANNKSGSTPFHLAVQNTGRGGSGEPAARVAQREIIQEFQRVGVSLELQDNRGKTVVDSARSEWVRELLTRQPL